MVKEVKNVEKGPQSLPCITLYNIVGKDARGDYKGVVYLHAYNDNPKFVTAFRQIQYKRGKTICSTGVGTLRNCMIELRFGHLTPTIQKTDIMRDLTPSFKTVKALKSQLIGNFEKELKKGKVFLRSFDKNKILRGGEDWTLDKRKLWKTQTHKVKIKPEEWVSIPFSIEKPGMIKINAPGAIAPRGLFRRVDEKIPDIEKIEEYCVMPPTNPLDKAVHGIPSAYNEKDGAIWIRNFKQKDTNLEWVFWFRDEALRDVSEIKLIFTYIDSFLTPFLPPFCDPWVYIEAHPRVAVVGEPITITVYARAFSGLDMFWWFGRGTGITELDKAHIMSGSGLVVGNHTWNITIDEPGTYTFGANARDLLYWTDPGVPHQASEGCGLAYDEIVVQPARKSYNVAFVLLAPEGTDITSTEFQGYLNKLDDIKIELVNQFATSTNGMGVVDTSYPTAVLTPPGPVYDLYDGSLMWTFLRETIRDYFYAVHPDIFDFLGIYEVYPVKVIGGRHMTIKTKVAGFGITPYDISASWGSAGKLRGMGLVHDIRAFPETYDFMESKMHLLLHEVFGHQWGVFAERIMKPGHHFDTGIESPTFTVLYGRPWRKIDETHFTTENVQDSATGTFKIIFHPWILYVAGMKTRSEIPEVLMDVEPDMPPSSRYDLITTTGTYQNVTLQSVIDASGDRYDVVW